MSDEARLADEIEAEAWRALFEAMPPAMASHTGARTAQLRGTALLIAPGIPDAYFNRAIGLGGNGEVEEHDVFAITDAFDRAGAKASMVHVSPYVRAHGDLHGWLRAAGYAPLAARPTWGKFLRGAALPPRAASALGVRRADAGDTQEVARALVAAHGMPAQMAAWTAALGAHPALTLYALTDGDAVVGGGLLYCQGARAWLGLGGTLASHRDRGGQKAVMERRVLDALAQGATHVATETGEPVSDEPNPSYGNMQKMGFRCVASRENWIRPAPHTGG